MADKQETITDIIKKTRAEADYIEETARGSLKAGENYDGIAYTKSDLESALDLAETKRKEADRLEAAHKRECEKMLSCGTRSTKEAARIIMRKGAVNAAKFYEALEAVRKYVKETTPDKVLLGAIEVWCDEALAEPVRNCDVGTVEEQSARFRKFCMKSSMDRLEATAYCAYECPCGNNYDCKLAWAQLPYESEDGEPVKIREGGAE